MLHNQDQKMDVVAEESKQIKEPETQVSSQPEIEEVKQASDKREQATLPQKNIMHTSKLIFKAKQAHLPKFSNLRSKRQPQALQLYLLGVQIKQTRLALLTSTRRKIMQALTELKLVTQVKHSFSIILRLICGNILSFQLDACEGDPKHKITCFSASSLLQVSQYVGI